MALEVIFNEMGYINLRFTYLLTYLLTNETSSRVLPLNERLKSKHCVYYTKHQMVLPFNLRYIA